MEKKVAEIFEEALEREKRKLNIIVSNLPESSKETPEERKKEDSDRVKTLVQKVSDIPEGAIGYPV